MVKRTFPGPDVILRMFFVNGKRHNKNARTTPTGYSAFALQLPDSLFSRPLCLLPHRFAFSFRFSCHDYSICIRDCQGKFANLPLFAIWKFRQIRRPFFVTVAQSLRYGVQNTHSAFVCPAIGSLYRTPVYRCKITRSIFTPQRKAPKYRIFRSLFVYWVYSAYRTNSSVWYSRITRLSGVTPSRKR